MNKKILRTKILNDNPRVIIETCVTDGHYGSNHDSSLKYSHTLYLYFKKSDFPNIKYPKIKEGRFDYFNSDFSDMDFHGGVTFYLERYYPCVDYTEVKVGCDYQHLHDDDYARDDNGEMLLTEGPLLFDQLVKLDQRRLKM